jgi:hypothetical protein
MKKAILKSIMISISIFTMVSTIKAEKIVSFDHQSKTITVSANFISFNKNNEALKDAISYWNNLSGRYTQNIFNNEGLETYEVIFDLTLNKPNADEKSNNVFSVVPNEHYLFKKNKMIYKEGLEFPVKSIAASDGYIIAVTKDYSNDKDVIAREIAYNLGLFKTESGIHDLTNLDLEKDLSIENSILDKKQKPHQI